MRNGWVLALTLATGLAVAACGGSAPGPPAISPHRPAVSPNSQTASSARPAAPVTPGAAAARQRIALTVPAAWRHGAFATRRTLLLPSGWRAQVWALVPAARMEVWTPQGRLLVSVPDAGRVTELTPGRDGKAPVARTLLSGLTSPQGLAFGRANGRTVLYVAESDRLDRYPWSTRGISGPRTIVAAHLPDQDPAGDDVHRAKDVTVARNGTVYFNVGSSSNASPGDRTMSPPRAVIMAVRPDGRNLRVAEKGVRNGEGLAVAPDGSVWTAVNNRDNIPYPFHHSYHGVADAFGQVIQAYVNDHPPDEVVPVTARRDLGWPYCDPDQDRGHPAGSLARIPFVANSVTNPGGTHLNCGTLPRVQAGLPAHSAPLGLTFLESSRLPAPWSRGAVIAAHGSWNRQPPRAPGLLWLAWDQAHHTLRPPVTLASGFQESDGSRWGRPADAVPGPDGSLYVSDDQAGAIYRLTPPGLADPVG
jgi:glucose/arabinose dehydrogenase